MSAIVGRTASSSDIERPAPISTKAHTCPDYARAEGDKLWTKVWQVACPVEEIPNVGDYVTYDFLDESIIVLRAAPRRIGSFCGVGPVSRSAG